MISSPAAYRDVQQELIAEIHTTARWPAVVTVNGNISIPEEADFVDKDGSFINTRWEYQKILGRIKWAS